MKSIIYIILLLFFIGCKSNTELALERGIQYYDWGKFDDAITEFNKAKYFQLTKRNETYADLQLLAQTHYNLAITYAKLNIYDKAIEEAQRSVVLMPNKEHRELLNLIRQKIKALQN